MEFYIVEKRNLTVKGRGYRAAVDSLGEAKVLARKRQKRSRTVLVISDKKKKMISYFDGRFNMQWHDVGLPINKEAQ